LNAAQRERPVTQWAKNLVTVTQSRELVIVTEIIMPTGWQSFPRHSILNK